MEVKASVLQHLRFKYACQHCERHAERTPVMAVPMGAFELTHAGAGGI